LPKGRRLSERHQNAGETIVVYPKVYAGLQAVHNFCNDDPPDVYLAVVLWSRIFPKLIPQDLREAWVMEKDCQGPVEFEVPLDSITDYSKKFLGYSLRKASLENVLSLLIKAELVEKKSNGAYKIYYRKFHPQQIGDNTAESVEEYKLDHTKEGIIDALIRGSRPKTIRSGRIPRTRRKGNDKNQGNFNF
jgi:hypothetical protein